MDILKLKVRDQEFKIKLVNNYAHLQWAEFATIRGELLQLPGELEDLSEEYVELQKEAPLTREQRKEFKQKQRELAKKQKELTEKVLDIREDIVKEIIETNNYEYDTKFWLHKVSPDDIMQFLNGCFDVGSKQGTGKK